MNEKISDFVEKKLEFFNEKVNRFWMLFGNIKKILSAFHNILFYTQLAFVFQFLTSFCMVCDHVLVFFLQ